MPRYIYEIKCNKCGFISPSGLSLKDIFAGFSLPSGRSRKRHIPTANKWCFQCGGIRPVETSDSRFWINQLQEVGRKISTIRFERDAITVDLNRIEGVPQWGGYGRIPVEERIFLELEDDISDAVAALNYLAGRTTPAQCLTCGGTQIDDVEMRHPDCGGLFTSECIIRMWLETDD